MPVVEAGVPPAEWRLSEQGRRNAYVLAEALIPLGATALYSSDERKAVETANIVAEELNLPVHASPGFREHARLGTPVLGSEEWQAMVLDAMNRPDELILGAQTVGDALRRFTSAVVEADLAAHPGPMVIVCHGTVISMFVARLLGIKPAPIWERLGLPGLIAVDWPTADRIELERDFGAGN